ncbi:MAG: hypothetical protein HYY45_00145 [Deltaproteobacteria bacterium]|nr:hypothetical protein [Deltaproteobacteria bacterium]
MGKIQLDRLLLVPELKEKLGNRAYKWRRVGVISQRVVDQPPDVVERLKEILGS